jgi:SAM-dependent methyltransferase
MKKPNYGIDAPGVILILLLFSILGACAALFAWYYPSGTWSSSLFSFAVWAGSVCFLEAVLMLLYARVGKFRHRNRMLKLYKIRGHEQVLDVGTGRGLLMIGAAKLLITGKATGIDIWSNKDLGNNKKELALKNAELEGVADKVNIETENITCNELPDSSFDLVLSNLCLHNIKNSEQREKACREIYRVLATGGTAVISDFRYTRQYASVFEGMHMEVSRKGPYLLDTFPPLTIVVARKIC